MKQECDKLVMKVEKSTPPFNPQLHRQKKMHILT